MLWDLAFSLFGTTWMVSGELERVAIELEGRYCWKNKEFGKQLPLCLFWAVLKARNRIVFRDDVLSIQKL